MSTTPSQPDLTPQVPNPLPSLPLELLSYIVQLTAEDYTCTFDPPSAASPTSAKALASLSLVSRAFRQLAQPLLFHDVTIGSKVQLERFFGAVGEIDLVWPLTVGRLVGTLRVGKLENSTSMASLLWQGALELIAAEDYRLEDLLRVCSRIKVLKVASVEKVDLESLRFAPELQSLYVWSCDLRLYDMPPPRSALSLDSDDEASAPSPPVVAPPSNPRWTPCIPQLKHLYLTDISLSLPIVNSLLTPSALPSLTTLSFALNDFRDPTAAAEHWRLNGTTMLVMSQVHSLSTSDNIDSTFAEATNLAFLDCWHLALTSDTICHLPPSIRFLRLNPIESLRLLKIDLFTQAWVKYEGSVLGRLEEVWVPANYEEDKTYDGLREMCKKKGVRLVFETRIQWEEGTKMDEESAYDAPYWALATRVERILGEERRKGIDV